MPAAVLAASSLYEGVEEEKECRQILDGKTQRDLGNDVLEISRRLGRGVRQVEDVGDREIKRGLHSKFSRARNYLILELFVLKRMADLREEEFLKL